MTIKLGILLLALFSSRLFAQEGCPSYYDSSCIDQIKELINNTKISEARAFAQSQCWGVKDGIKPTDRLRKAIYTRILGCFYQHELDQLLGNYFTAFEARQSGLGMASWGCQMEYAEYCHLLIDFVTIAIAELTDQFAQDLDKGRLNGFPNLAIARVKIGKNLPASFREKITDKIVNLIQQKTQNKVIPCKPCESQVNAAEESHSELSVSSERVSLQQVAFSRGIENFLTIEFNYTDQNPSLLIAAENVQARQNRWLRLYTQNDIRNDYRAMAFASGRLTDYAELHAYKPEYYTRVGLGIMRLANVGGDGGDSTMANLQLGSGERFNNRRSIFGLQLNLLRPMNAAKQANASSQESVSRLNAEPTKLEPYSSAIAVQIMYHQVFFSGTEALDRFRLGAHFGLGGFLGGQSYLAPLASVGGDIYMGSRFSVNMSLVAAGRTTVLAADKKQSQVKIKERIGSEFAFNYGF